MRLIDIFLLLLFPTLLLASADTAQSEARRWTSDIGSTIPAHFIELHDNDIVVLRTVSGRIIEIPRRRLSPEDREWIHATIAPEPSEASRVIKLWEPEVAQSRMDEVAAELTASLAAHAVSGRIARISVDVGSFTRDADETIRRHAIRTVNSHLVREENLVLLVAPEEAGVPSGGEIDSRKILVDLLVDETHREGYLVLSVPHPDRDFPEWVAGGYFAIADEDRAWMGFRQTERSDRYLPRLTSETLAELAELEDFLSKYSVSWAEPGSDRSDSLEKRLLQSLVVQQLVLPNPENSSGVEASELAGESLEEEAEAPEVVRVVLHLEKIREIMGVSTYDLRVVEERTGRLLVLRSLILERERETMAFLRRRMEDYWGLALTGDADRALEICRWVSDGQRRTLIGSTGIRHKNYLSRTTDSQREIGEVKVLGDCAKVVIRTTSGIGYGSSLSTFVVDQGEWKVWSFEKPQLSMHRFSPEQQERLLELREWGWDQLNVPEEHRQRMR